MIANIRNGVRYYPDGREVCQMDTSAGRKEYARRRDEAMEKQAYACAICFQHLGYFNTELDPIQPRGMGGARRDDRQENIQAVHSLCNSAKASKRTPYLITQQTVEESKR